MDLVRKVLLIYTGGTIGMVRDKNTKTLVPFNFDNLLSLVPELELLDCDIDTYSFRNPIDSSNIHPDDWIDLAKIIGDKYDDYDGFVILHGSDTMSYTASALSFLLENLKKPVIITGSQLPMGYIRTDAKENLITSIQIAGDYTDEGYAKIQEVALYFEYKLYRGNRTTKHSSEHFEAFASLNYPHLAVSGVHLKYKCDVMQPKNDKKLIIHSSLNRNVAILKLFPGITKEVVRAIINIENIEGLIIETYGAGNAPSSDWLITELSDAINSGLVVLNITQCPAGIVDQDLYEVGMQMKKLGVIGGRDMTIEAAITKLMFVLGSPELRKNPVKSLRVNLRGELSNSENKF